jgi:hypothetical protein
MNKEILFIILLPDYADTMKLCTFHRLLQLMILP